MIKTHKSGTAKAKVQKPRQTKYENASMYKNSRWTNLRLSFLKKNPLCADCQSRGVITPANEVDHITPHRGDMNLFLSTENLQSLCKPCHSKKTYKELGRGEGGATMTPEWFPVSVKPLVLVCGRPASGKTNYVAERRGENDLVIDLDDMAAKNGKRLFEMELKERNALIRTRNEILAKFLRGETRHDRAWITACCNQTARKFWEDRGAQVVIMDTPADVCQRRIGNMDLPSKYKIKLMQLAEDWK